METAAVEWAREVLAPDRVTWIRTRPWAEVWQLDTADDRYWLKINFRRTVYEPRLLELLQHTGADLLPPCIAHGSQPWALIRDAGQSARETLLDVDPGFRIDFWCRVLAQYAELQRASRQLDLTGVGVPDFSAARLLDRFDEALAEPGWLAPELVPPDEGFTERIQACRPLLAEAAQRLADGLPPTVQHDDLHDGNVFTRDGRTMLIDWGDAVFAHPFGTLLVTRAVLAAQLEVDVDDPQLRRVTDAYLEAWRTGGESAVELDRQLELALRTAPLGRAAGWQRALGDPAVAVEHDFGDAVAYWLLRLADAVTESG